MTYFAFKGQIKDGQLKAVFIGPFGTRDEAAETGQVIGGGVADVTFVHPGPDTGQPPAETTVVRLLPPLEGDQLGDVGAQGDTDDGGAQLEGPR